MSSASSSRLVQEVFPLGRQPWRTFDPFLFCVYHNDAFPEGHKGTLGPNPALLRGRQIGSDFSYMNGWSMYHGDTIPGFPQHPHRGFETITVTQKGIVDHFDSMGATGRYGHGDTQWMTAGSGVQHSEMFPLVHDDKPNPMELFQIWLNLPKKDKMCKPFFTMLWGEKTPVASVKDADGNETKIKVIAGGSSLPGVQCQDPPPQSWASNAAGDVAVWIIDVPPGATFDFPAAATAGSAANRAVYVYEGTCQLSDKTAPSDARPTSLKANEAAKVDAGSANLRVKAGPGAVAKLLMLQGAPIGEPVVQHGPFVMNTREEIQQTFMDYQRTKFGGWPWPSADYTHPKEQGRHAKHVGGREEKP